jgi:hypothetical protein
MYFQAGVSKVRVQDARIMDIKRYKYAVLGLVFMSHKYLEVVAFWNGRSGRSAWGVSEFQSGICT